MTYLTFLFDGALFLLLQCRVSLFGRLSKSDKSVSKNVTTFAFSGLYLTRTSSMEVKKIPVFSSYRCQDDLRLDKRLGLNSNFTHLYLYEA